MWRRRTRMPVLVATACAWVAAAELAAVQGPSMEGMHHPGTTDRISVSMVALMVPLMVAAMMGPLVIPAVRHVAARSLRRQRARRVTLLVVTHAVVWLVGGIAIQVVAGPVLGLAGHEAAPAAGLALALVWQMSPSAQRCANRHHAQPPLAAFGPAADLDVLAYGTRHAAYCLGACWPLMLLPALCGTHQLAVMALCSAWVWLQALENPTRPRWRLWLPARPGRLLRSHVGVAARLRRASPGSARAPGRHRPGHASPA